MEDRLDGIEDGQWPSRLNWFSPGFLLLCLFFLMDACVAMIAGILVYVYFIRPLAYLIHAYSGCGHACGEWW